MICGCGASSSFVLLGWGILIDGITSLTVETLSVGMLRGDVPLLDAAGCRALAHDLEQAEMRREPSARIFDREQRWAASRYGIVSWIGGRFFAGGEVKRRTEFESRSQQTIQRTRRLALRAAQRAYELELGKAASSPADLVPDFLSAVPMDPATGKPFTKLPSTAAQD